MTLTAFLLEEGAARPNAFSTLDRNLRIRVRVSRRARFLTGRDSSVDDLVDRHLLDTHFFRVEALLCRTLLIVTTVHIVAFLIVLFLLYL
jgi:hypothetical protein